jgi:hypothetical protein
MTPLKELITTIATEHLDIQTVKARRSDRRHNKMAAERALLEMGATVEKKKDRFGDTRTGWWINGVYLAPARDPIGALRAVKG